MALPSAIPGTLKGLLDSYNLPDPVLAGLAHVDIDTISSFGAAFESMTEAWNMHGSKADCIKNSLKHKGSFKLAWQQANKMVMKDIDRRIETGAGVDIEAPLGADEIRNLQKAFYQRYGFHPPDSWMGFQTMMNRFHREFQRGVHVVFKITTLKTLSNVIKAGPSSSSVTIAPALEFRTVTTEKGAELPITGLFDYFVALQAMLVTMIVAGCYEVEISARTRMRNR